MTSLRRQSRLHLRKWDRHRGRKRTKEDFCPEKKFYNSQPTAVTEPDNLQNAKQCFFMPTPSEQAKKMPYYDVHAKPLLKRLNFWNLAYLLKMPTWQH